MSEGTTRDRKERVAGVLMRLQNAAQQIRRECWDVVPVQDVSEQVELHDIKKLPSFWRSYHLLDDVVNVAPPVEDDVDDVEDGSKTKSKKPPAKKVLKKVSRVTRKPSKTLDLIMAVYI
jgi:tRNA G37 N-methylase Trm5